MVAGAKVASIASRAGDKANTKKGCPSVAIDEKLSLLVTLFRDGGIANSTIFEKEAKLSLTSVTPEKKGSEKTEANT